MVCDGAIDMVVFTVDVIRQGATQRDELSAGYDRGEEPAWHEEFNQVLDGNTCLASDPTCAGFERQDPVEPSSQNGSAVSD